MNLTDRFKLGRWMPVVTVAVTAGIFAWVAHLLAALSVHDIVRSVENLSARSVGLALALTAAGYAALTMFDYLGLRYVGRSLPYRQVALASFAALAIGHTVGLAPFSSGAVRYRYYSRWGLRKREIGMLVLFCAVTVGIGELAVSALVLLLKPDIASHILAADAAWLRALGAAGGAVLLFYIVLCASRRSIRVWKWSLVLPSWRIALGQLAFGLINYALVIGVLQVCLVSAVPIDYATACVAFVLANLAALVSTVPGGLGVIEAVILALLPGSAAAGGILAFRFVYFLVPFLLGLALLAATELRPGRQIISRQVRPAT
jgi:uncharacterized membrane protein YbhN (UPF0104 family)